MSDGDDLRDAARRLIDRTAPTSTVEDPEALRRIAATIRPAVEGGAAKRRERAA